MEFIAMDLIGEFHPASSRGNRYALTAVVNPTEATNRKDHKHSKEARQLPKTQRVK